MSFQKIKSKFRIKISVETKVVFQQILIILTLPLILWFTLLSVIYKGFVIGISKLLRYGGHHYVQPLNGMDMMFVCDKFYTKPHSTIMFIFILEGIPDKKRMLEDLQSVYDVREGKNKKGKRCYWKMSAYPKKLGGYWFWKKVPDFKMEDQVTFVPDGDVQLSTDGDLSNFVERIIRKPFRKNGPCWHLTVVGNYLNDPNRSVMIHNGSHLVFDGYSFAKWHFRISGLSVLPQDFPSSKASGSELSIYNRIRNLASHWGEMLSYGFTEYLQVFNSPPDHNALLRNGLQKENANDRVQGSSQWHCSFTPKIPIELVKMARKSFNTTFYGILMAGVIGGFRSFIVKQDHLSPKDIPEWVRSLLPSSKAGHPENTLTNHWRPVIMKLPMGDLNTAESIVEMQHALDAAIASTSSEFSVFVFNLLSLFPVASLIESITRFDGLTLISSITPNAAKLPPIFGLVNSEIFHVVPLFRETLAGISWSCMSSNGTIRVCITADDVHLSKDKVQEVTTLIYEEFIKIFEQAQQLSKS